MARNDVDESVNENLIMHYNVNAKKIKCGFGATIDASVDYEETVLRIVA